MKRILATDDAQTVRGTGHWTAGVAILLTVLIVAAAQSVQGRQIVQGVAQGVAGGTSGGAKDGVTAGVSGGVAGGVSGGVTGAMTDAASGAVSGGVPGGVAGGIRPPRQVSAAPATDYKIQPLDVLKVIVSSGGVLQQEFGQDHGVQPDGSITLPILGRIVVGMQTFEQTAKQIKDALVLHRLLTDATVEVSAVAVHRVFTPAERSLIEAAPDDAPARPVKAQLLQDLSYADFASGRYDLAIEGFKTLLRVYPDEAAAPRAQFFIAEAHFASRRYSEAQAAYSAYIEKYPGTWWKADAYYKRALCFEALGARDKARADFEFVIKTFPASELTPLAKARVRASYK